MAKFLDDKKMQCPNCTCCTDATITCDGCDEILCALCWLEHNEDWPDHTEHVAVMRDRGMSEAEIQADLDFHRAGTPPPNYHDEEEVK